MVTKYAILAQVQRTDFNTGSSSSDSNIFYASFIPGYSSVMPAGDAVFCIVNDPHFGYIAVRRAILLGDEALLELQRQEAAFVKIGGRSALWVAYILLQSQSALSKSIAQDLTHHPRLIVKVIGNAVLVGKGEKSDPEIVKAAEASDDPTKRRLVKEAATFSKFRHDKIPDGETLVKDLRELDSFFRH